MVCAYGAFVKVQSLRNPAKTIVTGNAESAFHTEFTVQSRLEDGRSVDARLDLLVETAGGFYIVDHKLSHKPVVNADEMIALLQDGGWWKQTNHSNNLIICKRAC